LIDTKNAKLSIGLPVYNGEKYIRNALLSLINQTFSDFEIIISDNCSTDNTREICEHFVTLDPRITYLRQSANIGLYSWIKIVEKSRGKYFMFAPDDDYWPNNALQILVDYADIQSDKSLLIYGVHQRVSDSGIEMPHYANYPVKYESNFKLLNFANHLIFHHERADVNAMYGLWKNLQDVYSFINFYSKVDYLIAKNPDLYGGVPPDLVAISNITRTIKIVSIKNLKHFRRLWTTRYVSESFSINKSQKKSDFMLAYYINRVFNDIFSNVKLNLRHFRLLYKEINFIEKMILLIAFIPSTIVRIFVHFKHLLNNKFKY